MTTEEFLRAYANTPLEKRHQTLDIIHLGMDVTLSTIYQTVTMKNDLIRELQEEKQDLIDLASSFITPPQEETI